MVLGDKIIWIFVCTDQRDFGIISLRSEQEYVGGNGYVSGEGG